MINPHLSDNWYDCRSHIDTTAVQALIDARNEIERWADHPVEFHFATILSPWIRRALVAGGFGIGLSSSKAPQDFAALVPYRDGASSQSNDVDNLPEDDIESGLKKGDSHPSSGVPDGFAPILPVDTPFFHIDLLAAVWAAESGVPSS